jgi:ABC-type oligopeptide transport system ATPase subunit
MVMCLGRAVECGSRDAVFNRAAPSLCADADPATSVADTTPPRQHVPSKGELPLPISPPTGFAFHPRCPLAFERYRVERPELEKKGDVEVARFAVSS